MLPADRSRCGPGPFITRLTLFVLTLATSAAAGGQFLRVFEDQRAEPLEVLLLLLFIASFSWLALSFWSAIGGWLALTQRWQAPGLPEPLESTSLSARTALIMPIHNEDPVRVFAALQAMYEELDARHAGAGFDIFILSDSTDPDVWIAEEAAWHELCRRVGGHGRIFYRKRRHNVAHKSGNIADFCRRWGRRYDYMVVLDADSLMTADALLRLVALMNANPRTALMQVPPTIVNAVTLFGRLQQFASRLYGPVFAAGTALWQQGDGNYWGHNAIIRIAPFIAHCGLPELPGRGPFGGHIMSHDFVEAALLRRAGWQVWMASDLGGSYEETPPTLIDHAKRDRRWCQGNLQHLRILPASGLHPVSRLHMFIGIMSYLASPIWLAFLGAGVVMVAWKLIHPPVYFPPYQTLFPLWPSFDRTVAIGLATVVVCMLLLPRLLGLLFAFSSRQRRAGFGGAGRLLRSFLFEMSLSTLMAPVLMLLQSGFVLGTLIGWVPGWRGQRRNGDGLSWREAWRSLGWQSLVGIALAVAVGWVAPELAWWLVPVLGGLILAVPLTVLTSGEGLGTAVGHRGLLWTSEEIDPPAVLVRMRALLPAWRTALGIPGDALGRLAGDRALLALHLALLPDHSDAEMADDAILAAAHRKLPAGADGTPLSRDEVNALLFDAPYLERLAASATDRTDTVIANAARRMAEPAAA